MYRSSLLALPFVLFACGSAVPAHEHPAPLSVSEHEQHAQSHDKAAQESNEQVEPGSTSAEQVQCVDIGGPLNSGGERMPVMKPCWTQAEQNDSYLRAAAAHRRAAEDHRHWAEKLVQLETTACKEMGTVERQTSPFVRSPDILSVEEYREDKKLMGTRVTFRKVEGLSKAWLSSSIRCHQARAATLGYSQAFMPHCPLTLQKTSTSVEETSDTVVATLRSVDPRIAAQLYGRALRAGDDNAKK